MLIQTVVYIHYIKYFKKSKLTIKFFFIYFYQVFIFKKQIMIKNKYWFSLVEIIIAASILTIWVFGVYKMLWINIMMVSNHNMKSQNNILLSNMTECLNAIWYDSLSWSYNIWSGFSINFWNSYTWCLTWSYDTNYTFSWVYLENWSQTWSNYYLFGKVVWKNSNFIKLELNIYSPETWYMFATGSSDNIWTWTWLTITK